jgi:hypothetical protein
LNVKREVKTMQRQSQSFAFEGGRDLTTMGATWFVSYAYFIYIDRTHRNWERVKTAGSRASTFERSGKYHRFWLLEILKMNELRLKTNTLGVTPAEVKQMAEALLAKL